VIWIFFAWSHRCSFASNGGDPQIYYRGNKSGVDAQFTPPIKRLAFQPNFPEEQTFPEIVPDPLPVVASPLSHRSLERIWREHSLTGQCGL
jgi:hypothetical protein